MHLDGTARELYSRQIMMKEIGEAGQRKLKDAWVLVIGAGGLGSPAALYLAAAGVGTLGICDGDAVDLSNLQRQILHGTGRLGQSKALSARVSLADINPNVQISTYDDFAGPDNLPQIIESYDFVLDCTDSFEAKFLINDTCVILKKPFSHGGIEGFKGQTMTYIPGKGPCYRCIFTEPPDPGAGSEIGVLGAVPGVIGCIQATETLKYLLGMEGLLNGWLLIFNSLCMEFRKVSIRCSKDCRACGEFYN